jgi:hypothetical protein
MNSKPVTYQAKTEARLVTRIAASVHRNLTGIKVVLKGLLIAIG